MSRKNKTITERQAELLETIATAKKKLEKLQQSQKIEIGELAYKHGLNKFDHTVLDVSFKKLSEQLSNAN